MNDWNGCNGLNNAYYPHRSKLPQHLRDHGRCPSTSLAGVLDRGGLSRSVEMNHHADKLVHPATSEEAKKIDAAIGGIIEEMHCCPGCGVMESRRAQA